MSHLLQGTVVGLIVAACALYSVWRLLSARLRSGVLDLAGRAPGVGRAAWFVALRARAQLAGGCGSCAPAATSAASRKQTPGALHR